MLAGLRVGCAPMAIHTKVPAALSAHSSWLGQSFSSVMRTTWWPLITSGLVMAPSAWLKSPHWFFAPWPASKCGAFTGALSPQMDPGHAPGGYHV